MPTTVLNKTAGTALLAYTIQPTATVTIGSAVDVSTKLGPATVLVKIGRTAATALSNQVKFRIEMSAKATGNDEWYPIHEWATASATTGATSTTLNDATVAIGDTTFTVTSGTGIVAGDIIFLRETVTPANSEWARVESVSTNDITLEEPLTRAHTDAINVADLGEMFAVSVDLSRATRIRLIVDTASAVSGVDVAVIAWLVTADSATST